MFWAITGTAKDQHRDHWKQMQDLLRSEAKGRCDEALPRGTLANDEPVRTALEETFLELARLEQTAETGRIYERDLGKVYLRLRQSIEAALKLTFGKHPPGNAWKKIESLGRRESRPIIQECGSVIGFPKRTVPKSVKAATWGQLKWVCENASSGNIRPSLAALILAATDDPTHPLREVAAVHPNWLMDVDHLAKIAGGHVHTSSRGQRRELITIQDDMRLCTNVLRSLLGALGNTNRGRQDGKRKEQGQEQEQASVQVERSEYADSGQ